MKGIQFPKSTLGKRVDFIEKVVGRLARRTKTKHSVMVPALPISTCVIGDDVRGEVLRYMFCSSGTLTKAIVDVNKKPKEPVKIDAAILGPGDGNVKSYVLEKRKMSTILNLQVNEGDKLIVSVTPAGDYLIKEIWVSFLWSPSVGGTQAMKILADDLDKYLEEDI